ncbi:MAG TPA: endonuclease domain-containing protein [Tepidisphaeraceae bacterium]|jgi:very-short-patch-repair endonuclease
MAHRDYSSRLLNFAREMRYLPTDAEKKLWSILRGRKLGGFKFRRQHPIEGYILDFYCIEQKLAVEADGGQHLDEKGKEYDARRTERLGKLGVRVLRFGDDDVLKHSVEVAEEILRTLMEGTPSPLPSPRYGRGGESLNPHPRPLPGTGEGEVGGRGTLHG